jgi:hypothetical protein
MPKLSSTKLALAAVIFSCCNLIFPPFAKAEDTAMTWSGQLYGGKYYKDDHIGGYGISSISFGDAFMMTGEILRERYHNRDRDYYLSSVGAHLLWRPSEGTKLGLTGSHSRERYSYSEFIEGFKTRYRTNTIALEGELDYDPVTLAAQTGKVANDDDYIKQHHYYSISLFYWGADHLWYGRSAIRRIRNYREYTLEASRTFFAGSFPASVYAGATRDNLISTGEVSAPPGQYNSYYMGCNFQFITTTSSAWSLWAEAARQSSETILSLELNISFGPGGEAPSISSLDYIR